MSTDRTAVITVSDRAAAGVRDDASGPAACAVLAGAGCTVPFTAIVPDDIEAIQQAVRDALAQRVAAVLLTGGTGIAERDVTIPAVQALLDTELPGIGEELRRRGSAAGAPGALLSRSLGGLLGTGRDAVLLIAAPGSVGGARDGAELLAQLVGHVRAQLRGDTEGGHTR